MGLDYANAGQLPNAPREYSPEHIRQLIRVLEIYFSQLDSKMPRSAEQYTAERFIGGDFYGGRFFGNGNYLNREFQRFDSNANQTPLAVDVAYPVVLDTAEFPGSSITLVGLSQITVAVAGVYRLDFELQFNSTSSGTEVVHVWLRKNGVDIPNSNSRYAVPVKVGGTLPSVTMAQQSFIGALAAGDHLEVVWSPDNTAISLRSYPALAANPGVNPAIPATPSAVIIVSLLQGDFPVDATLRTPRRLLPP